MYSSEIKNYLESRNHFITYEDFDSMFKSSPQIISHKYCRTDGKFSWYEFSTNDGYSDYFKIKNYS